MAVHDWTRVPPGVFHDFHLAWMVEIHRCLNRGLLPDSHYALLEMAAAPDAYGTVRSEPEDELLAARRRRVMVRRSADDERVSSVEIVSPGKAYGRALDAMLNAVVKDLQAGFHLLLIDLFPPGHSDPKGTHAAVLRRLGGAYEGVPQRWKRVIEGAA